MKEYNVGDVVWWAKCEANKNIREVCPICLGKQVVGIILGSGEQVEVECDFCGKGYERARGYVNDRYEWTSAVKQIILDRKEVNETSEGRKIEYRYENWSIQENRIFSTKEEAEVCVVEMVAEHERDEALNMERKKEYANKSYAWHVGYHRRCATKAKKDLEYHESKVIAMKKLSKDKEV
jgi:hypothetical protein